MGACFARVQCIAAQEEIITAQNEIIQDLHETLDQLEEANKTLLKQLMSEFSN